MSRFVRLFATIAAAIALTLALAVPARADDDPPREWKITRYDAQVRTDGTGTSTVTLNFDFDFGNSPGHGPFVTLPTRQLDGSNPDRWRMLDVALGAVTSRTGAPTEVKQTTEDGSLVIRIGREGTRVRGVQSYTLTYTIRGLVAPDQEHSGMDEISFNAVGTGWQVPMSNITATVTGPVPAQAATCFWGDGFTQECQASAGTSSTYSQPELRKGEGFQVVAGFPVGTFTGAEPRYEKRYHLGNMFPATPLSLGLTAALGVLASGLVLLKARRWRRDEVYLGLTPGVRPATGEEARVGLSSAKAPVTVQFAPPAGAHPGEVGVLLDTRADNVDVTATVLDLAARGHFQIVEDSDKQWRFVRRQSNDPVTVPEQHVLDELFRNGDQVTTEELRDKDYHGLMAGARTKLQTRVTKDLHWFKGSPQAAQALAVAGAVGLIVAGAILGLVLAFAAGLGLVGLGLVAAGVLLLSFAGRAGRRTAEGSAVLAQAKGFELYLRTAEADQIKFEEGVDVFSTYLPYATIFGVADRWAKIFQQLAQEGRYTPTDWYVGHGVWNGYYFASAMNGLSSALSSSMQAAVSAQTAATAGSSGGSGFSGGGGFGGGGGGGW